MNRREELVLEVVAAQKAARDRGAFNVPLISSDRGAMSAGDEDFYARRGEDREYRDR